MHQSMTEKQKDITANRIPLPERYHCMAEERARRFGFTIQYDDIGEELLALRKQAFDLYGATCLWNVRGNATITGLRALAEGLHSHGDLGAARLAAEILAKTGWGGFLAP